MTDTEVIRKRNKAYATLEPRRMAMLRTGLGLTQQELADICGTSRQTISNFENGLVEESAAKALVVSVLVELCADDPLLVDISASLIGSNLV